MNIARRPAFAETIAAALRGCDVEPIRVLPLLTVVLLLTAAPSQWYLVGPLVALFALGVVYRRWLARPAFWYVVATLLGTTVYLNWESSDNHKYLFVYWCLALTSALSLPREQQAPALAKSSRWLIGLCMLLAVLWKVALPDYRSGTFFHYTLLADDRFAQFTSLAAGVPLDQLRDNEKLVELLRAGHLTAGPPPSSVVLASLPAVGLVALAMTWWTVAIEGLLAVLFLAPDSRRVAAGRNLVLILFAATTYLIAPVRGFGWMLMLLGLAQCEDRDRIFRPLFLAALVLIQIYTLPVATIVQRLAQ